MVEMLVVIVLMAILMALALPSFNGLIEKFRVEGVASAFAASVTYARTEAARQGRTVTIRQRAGCSDTDWSCGWDVVTAATDAEVILKRQDPDSRVVVTKKRPGVLSFSAMGHSSNFTSFRFRPAGSATESETNNVALCVALGGRVKLVKGVSECPN